MRWHDFGSGREARRSQYREYWQGERQSHGPKLVPAPGGAEGPHPLLGVATKTGGTPERGAGTRLRDATAKACTRTAHENGVLRPAARSHPSIERLEPAPPCAGHFVGRLDHAPRTRSRAAGCGKGRQAACGCDSISGLMRLLPQTGLRLTSRSRRDIACAVLRVSTNFASQRTRVSLG